jgi:hypothetical protein
LVVDFPAEALRRAETLAAFAMARRAGERVAATRVRDFDLEVDRALAPAFDFFELFFTEDIRGSLLPRSARQARNTLTGEAIRELAERSAFRANHRPRRFASTPVQERRIKEPAESESRVEKGSRNGAL